MGAVTTLAVTTLAVTTLAVLKVNFHYSVIQLETSPTVTEA
jgi:hypothetical protein